MNRREFLRASAAATAAATTTGCHAFDNDHRIVPGLPTPTPAQLAWQRAELGFVYHYDLHLFDDERYVQSKNRRRPPPSLDAFDPQQLDTDQWIAAAVDAGARFALLTASHETGFRLWPSDANSFSVRHTPWRGGRGDVVADFVASCRKAGIAPGIYLGTRWNAQLSVLDFKVQPDSPLTQAAYNTLIEREVEEICTRYGPLFELWFDGGILAPASSGPDVLPIFERHQPDGLFYHSDQRADARWGGTESGTVGDPCWATVDMQEIRNVTWNAEQRDRLRHGDPNGNDWCPAMADAPLRNHEWFWEPDDEHKLYSTEELTAMYFASVGRNSTLILGATPDRSGLLPTADVERMRQMGRQVQRVLGTEVATTSGGGTEITVDLPGGREFDVVILQEEIEFGERVREYVVDARSSAGAWQTIASGTCIGQKRIHRVPRRPATALRLRITAATALPRIARMSVRASNP